MTLWTLCLRDWRIVSRVMGGSTAALVRGGRIAGWRGDPRKKKRERRRRCGGGGGEGDDGRERRRPAALALDPPSRAPPSLALTLTLSHAHARTPDIPLTKQQQRPATNDNTAPA
jgi:hypothetical protein